MVIAIVVYGVFYLWLGSKNSGNPTYRLPANETLLPATVLPETSAVPGAVVTSRTPEMSVSADVGQPTVAISNFAFQPAQLTVPIGTTVTFTNNDSVAHTATSDTGVFDSGMLPKGQSYEFTFTKAGSFPYYCIPHPAMKATIIVQ